MMLTPDKSLCELKQKLIVSRDKGSPRSHRAVNPGQKYAVRQYKLDGDIITQQTCCDFLLLNDTLKKAYFIELKGGNIDEAVPQLEQGERLFRAELSGYKFFFRIVPSKVRTLDLRKNTFRKFKDKYGSCLQYKTDVLEETL